MPEQNSKKARYIDEKGRQYTIESSACAASIGTVAKVFNVIYENGARATISESAHRLSRPFLRSGVEKIATIASFNDSDDKLVSELFLLQSQAESNEDYSEWITDNAQSSSKCIRSKKDTRTEDEKAFDEYCKKPIRNG